MAHIILTKVVREHQQVDYDPMGTVSFGEVLDNMIRDSMENGQEVQNVEFGIGLVEWESMREHVMGTQPNPGSMTAEPDDRRVKTKKYRP